MSLLSSCWLEVLFSSTYFWDYWEITAYFILIGSPSKQGSMIQRSLQVKGCEAPLWRIILGFITGEGKVLTGPCLGHSHTLDFCGQEIISGSILGLCPLSPMGSSWQLVD